MPRVCFLTCSADNVDDPHLPQVQLKSYVDLIRSTCQQLSLEFVHIKLEEEDACETLYAAKLSVVLITPSGDNHCKNSIFYHLGVRHSVTGNNQNLILYHNTDTKLKEALKTPYFAGLAYATMYYQDLPPVGPRNSLLTHFNYLLKEAEVTPVCQSNGVSAEEIEKLCQSNNGKQTTDTLENMKIRLRQPGAFSKTAFLALLNAYRDAQAYTMVIDLIDEWSSSSCPVTSVREYPIVCYHYAFALNRRNTNGDREAALEVVNQLLTDGANHTSDILCLCGRIYKDRFVQSRYTASTDLQQAIEWYRKGYLAEVNIHAGINLLTLLVVSGEHFPTSNEMHCLSLVLNNLVGRKGKLESLEDYWDVATLFELSVLLENHDRAVLASHKMLMLKPPKWCLKSTLGNVVLIKDFLKKNPETEQTPSEKLFNAWVDFLAVYCGAVKEEKDSMAFTVLVIESREQATLTKVLFDLQEKTISIQSCNQLEEATVFSASQVGGVCLSRRDEWCAFLCVRDNWVDYELMFASVTLRDRFNQTVRKMTG